MKLDGQKLQVTREGKTVYVNSTIHTQFFGYTGLGHENEMGLRETPNPFQSEILEKYVYVEHEDKTLPKFRQKCHIGRTKEPSR